MTTKNNSSANNNNAPKFEDEMIDFFGAKLPMRDVLQLLEVQRIAKEWQAAVAKLSQTCVDAAEILKYHGTNIGIIENIDSDQFIDLIRDKMSDEQKNKFDDHENFFNALHYASKSECEDDENKLISTPSVS